MFDRIHDWIMSWRAKLVDDLRIDDSLKQRVMDAAKSNDTVALSELVEIHGAAAIRMDTDPGELTTLHLAAASGALEVVNYLLTTAVSADTRATRVNNFTPLHAGAMYGHTAVCEELLRRGADVNVQTDPQKYSPLHSAAFAGHIATIRILLAHGANRELLNYRNERPADTALRQSQSVAAEVLTRDEVS